MHIGVREALELLSNISESYSKVYRKQKLSGQQSRVMQVGFAPSLITIFMCFEKEQSSK